MPMLIAEDEGHRKHRHWLRNLLETTKGLVRIASPYITESDLLRGSNNRTVRLLTSLWPMDIVSGATSLESLKSLIETGVQCRYLSDDPRLHPETRLHAKVYVFGDEFAIVTSANLTKSGLDKNIEVGVQLSGSAVQELADWFDSFWKNAKPLNVTQLSKWEQETALIRREYSELRKKASGDGKLVNEKSPSDHSSQNLRTLFDTTNRFFLCNTDRAQGDRTSSGGYFLEEAMHQRGYAAAWRSFRYASHMMKVERGDAIFMFAKGVGIIGIGRAKDGYRKLGRTDPDRIRRLENEEAAYEWRIPVESDWLVWVKDESACPWKRLGNVSFLDISGDRYRELRLNVKKHFVGAS